MVWVCGGVARSHPARPSTRFCAHPLLARLSPAGTAVRASLGLGSRANDVDRLVTALAALAGHGPAWTYAGAEQGYIPLPDPRALPGWLTGAADSPRRGGRL